ncbi:hypothetical protein [Robertmurraya korlensis]|uniref:hypothetical protein n=1 Tax=Robertmurraya korlensis TaxID=519977 RepID=UPI0008264FE6|nr:hypothetical protein [Robertmurraya korlensis]
MGFVFYFFVSWLVTVLFTVMKKSLSFVENIFVFLIILIVSVNWSWIIFEEFKFLELSRQPLDYTAFLMNRSIGIPLIIVITLNAAVRSANVKGKAYLYVGLSTVILLGLKMIGNFLNITKLNNWNTLYDVLYFISLHLIAYFSLQMYRKLIKEEVTLL